MAQSLVRIVSHPTLIHPPDPLGIARLYIPMPARRIDYPMEGSTRIPEIMARSTIDLAVCMEIVVRKTLRLAIEIGWGLGRMEKGLWED